MPKLAAVNVDGLRNQGCQDGTISGLLSWHEGAVKQKVFSFM